MRIQSISDDFMTLIEGTARVGRVHSVFTRVVNLLVEGRLYALASAEVPLGPATAVLGERVGFDRLGIAQNDEVVIHGTDLTIGTLRVMVPHEGLSIWHAKLDFPGGRISLEALKESLGRMALILAESGDRDSLVALVPLMRPHLDWICPLPMVTDDFRMAHLERIEERWVRFFGIFDSDDAEIAGAVRRIIGFGPGLTPSTDDFLVGFMAGLLCSSDEPERWAGRFPAWISDAKEGTTLISYEALRHAAEGRFNKRLADAARAATGNGDTGPMTALLEIGQTSGTDLMVGLYFGIAYNVYKGERFMGVHYEIRKNTYYDSVTLMLISKDISKLDGVQEAIVGMGTDLNKELARGLGVSNDEIQAIGANDFFISALLESEDAWSQALALLEELLNKKTESAGSDYRPKTLQSALNFQTDSNLALISVPGQYAASEAKKALEAGLHVMLFSDNVGIDQELELKRYAYDHELLMMGPDCGTAIINHVPLAFANVIREGKIGIVGASGTGTQEVSVIIDKLGQGVSQVIGTGGRDLKEEIGGLTMLTGIRALMEDPLTEVIVLISKPPAEAISRKILALVKESDKPVVVDFIGGDPEMIRAYGAYPSATLEDCARKAVLLAEGKEPEDFDGFTEDETLIDKLIDGEVARFDPRQRYIRGLYTGGTLTDEAMKLLEGTIGGIHSNTPLSPEFQLEDSSRSVAHTCIDLGDDEFTQGRPHPMIDPSTRADRLKVEAQDPEVAVVLMDFVLGYGSNPDPVGEMLEAIDEAKATARARGQHLSMVCSICGTDKDPQDMEESKTRLEAHGVIVMPSNAQAVRFVMKMAGRIQE